MEKHDPFRDNDIQALLDANRFSESIFKTAEQRDALYGLFGVASYIEIVANTGQKPLEKNIMMGMMVLRCMLELSEESIAGLLDLVSTDLFPEIGDTLREIFEAGAEASSSLDD